MEDKHIKLKSLLFTTDKIFKHILRRMEDKDNYIFSNAFHLLSDLYFKYVNKINRLRRELKYTIEL